MPINTVTPARRAAVLSHAQSLKMARSAHAYVRGSTQKFYEWLDAQDDASIPAGPPIWICGDCHVGNLGPLAAEDGSIQFQIRDLDQTVIGNPVHDLIRLALSLTTAARGSDLPGVTASKIVEQIVAGYAAALERNPDEIEPPPRTVSATMRRSIQRTWKHLAKERLKGEALSIPRGKRFWPLKQAEARALRRLIEAPDFVSLATGLRSRDNGAPVKLIDAAYWMKGCSSLGKLRIAVLLEIGDKSDRDLALIDIKEAVAALAPRSRSAKMPRNHGQRVVEGARHLSPNLGRRMLAASLLGKSVFVRELLPQDLKLEIEQISRSEAMQSANYLASVVGRAHARQMDERTRLAWAREVRRGRRRTIDAPSWLWDSVVSLVGVHEMAYLDHCRRYANGPTA